MGHHWEITKREKEKYEREAERHGGKNEKFPHMWVEIPGGQNREMSKEDYVKKQGLRIFHSWLLNSSKLLPWVRENHKLGLYSSNIGIKVFSDIYKLIYKQIQTESSLPTDSQKITSKGVFKKKKILEVNSKRVETENIWLLN